MKKYPKNEIEEYYDSLPQGRCHPCKYARAVFAQDQFMLLGCYHEPYRGKWVAEIKECPKAGEQATKMNDKQKAMDKLYEHKNMLTYQQYRTFRGQICAGDIEGFRKGLKRILA